MNKVIFSLALLAGSLSAHANNFNMPSFGNNNNGFNNGSSWSMPNMNFGNNNNNGFSNGSNWNMPNMNWGNGNNGINNGSNWSMPNMNWGNGASNNAGNNWTMPNMNFGNNNVPNFNNPPVANHMQPAVPTPPQFIPRLNNQQAPQVQMSAKAPTTTAKLKQAFQAPAPTKLATTKIEVSILEKIPTPSEVKGTILAPVNKTMEVEATTK